MSKINFRLLGMLFLATIVSMSACEKDDPEPEPEPVVILDGYYVKGAAVAYADFNEAAMMKSTVNEVGQVDRASLLELYIPVKATDGFNIVKVAGSANTTYGPSADFAKVDNPTGDEPHDADFYRGSIEETSTTFTVPEDGFYHVVFDTELNKVVVARVHWGMIGASTPGGWSGSTDMTESAFDTKTMKWNIDNMEFQKGDWKFRYSAGWKIEIDTVAGVKVNTNFGGAIDALVPGGGNIGNDAPGIYSCELSYTLGSGYTASLTKTGDIPAINYSAYEMGLIGNAYFKANGDTAAWDENFGTSLPTVAGDVYEWTYTTDFILDGAFKIRQGDDWAGKIIGYTEVTFEGSDAADFADDGGNIKVVVGGNYTLVLKIDAATEMYTITATKN
ncbi:MAG: hypothetical protein DRI86_13725 [Bacteroidetes bacterium]|nr:MAG: hypothetical protein DRI86_13725 [Bacteroidota bacterium]